MKRILSLTLALVISLSAVGFSISADASTTTSQAGIVQAIGGLNVRASATTSAKILKLLSNGSQITLIEKTGAWWKVEYADGAYGYCHGDYIHTQNSTTAVVSTDYLPLNIRSGPGTSYNRIGSLAKGKTVIVLSTANGWSKVLYAGTKTGYVSAQYLAQGSGYTAIHLNVPAYKQADSRWGWVTLGSSGKTMAKIGCATTGIAMMESYRTGTTIYPDAMSKKLNYTSSGDVYWPSHFVVTYPDGNYLQDIYNILKQGKAVLIGGRSNSGAQHWVVITGFRGGILIASNFTINDPGSGTKTNLQEYLNGYPILYKYFTY